MMQRAEETLVERLEGLPTAGPAQVLQSLADRAVGSGPRKNLLTGTWLGHALHPPLTDLTLGAWVGASLLDLTPTDGSRRAAQRLVGLGLLSSLPTALAGMADWTDTGGSTRRLGVLHAWGNVAVQQLFVLSWLARRRGRHGLGRLFGAAAMTVGMGTAWLGGHLLMRKGVGVDHTVFLALPAEWTPVAEEAAVVEGVAHRAEVSGTPLLLLRYQGRLHAIVDRCSHRGGPLHQGKVKGCNVTCPWHGSTFCVEDGSVVNGPATAPQPALETRVVEGRVEVRATAAA